MPLEIPKEESGAIATIKALAPVLVEKFIAAIKVGPITSDPQEMIAYVAKEVPSIPAEQLSRMIETLYSLYQIRELSGVKHSQFLEDLIDGIQKAPDLKLVRKDLPKLQSLLEKLLNIDSLKTVAKAARLQRDGERLYCNAKILSDIRPVFCEDPTSRPESAVVTHTLKIGYHEGSGHRELHVVLDFEDLASLESVVHRAIAKDKTLRELMKGARLASLDE